MMKIKGESKRSRTSVYIYISKKTTNQQQHGSPLLPAKKEQAMEIQRLMMRKTEMNYPNKATSIKKN